VPWRRSKNIEKRGVSDLSKKGKACCRAAEERKKVRTENDRQRKKKRTSLQKTTVIYKDRVEKKNVALTRSTSEGKTARCEGKRGRTGRVSSHEKTTTERTVCPLRKKSAVRLSALGAGRKARELGNGERHEHEVFGMKGGGALSYANLA